jgi:hypothetical protein
MQEPKEDLQQAMAGYGNLIRRHQCRALFYIYEDLTSLCIPSVTAQIAEGSALKHRRGFNDGCRRRSPLVARVGSGSMPLKK